MEDTKCEICGKPVPDYKPEYCCGGHDCGCCGLPIEPCTCSIKCESALYKHIGATMDMRRKIAGIEKWALK